MTLTKQHHQQLRSLLGQAICYGGENGQIIEFLEQEQALVVQLHRARGSVQDGQYGEPNRRVPTTCLLPIFDPEQPQQLNPALQALNLRLDD